MFQKEIYDHQAFGIVGELVFDGPTRAQPAILNTPDEANNVIGRACTVISGGTGSPETAADPKPIVAQVGGAGVFAGILAHPKAYAAYGSDLAATDVVKNNVPVELVTMGEILVRSVGGSSVGAFVLFDTSTGEISFTDTPNSPPAGKVVVPNATVTRFANAGAGVAVIKLTN